MRLYLLPLTQSLAFTYKRVIYIIVRCHCNNKYSFIVPFMFSKMYNKHYQQNQ